MKSYDVRIWSIRKRPTKKASYEVRWKVASTLPFSETFRTKALADNFRAQLLRAVQNGEAFDSETGLPDSMATVKPSLTWYDFARAYIAMKWPHAAPNSRDSANETMTLVTTQLLDDRPGRPTDDVLRRALRGWAFVVQGAIEEPPPVDIANALHWVAKASLPLATLKNPADIRRVLDSLKLTLSGATAAAETVRRKRAVLFNALAYAVELGELPENPVTLVKWKPPKVTKEVDRRVVVNPRQAGELLAAVSYVGGYSRARGRRLVALFACMYFGGLRPAEAVALRRQDCTLPDSGWGSLILEKSRPTVGKRWTGTGAVHDDRGLKNRPANETRIVPVPPRLVGMLHAHIAEFGTAKDGRLFANERGGVVASTTYWRVWDEARHLALTPEQAASPLAARPYDLRHAALSSWLNAGVDPTEVAERAGNSVEVLLSRYAKCLDGRQDVANRRIAELLGEDGGQEDKHGDGP
ncbi:tyrosine-type recombinase/integrase [Streptomyces sp. NPDC006872]|uniref:tyrosine-type recombinase/integrase n=1 Tax=Streptomyces sp. NPDC006872 TaxID=3155720 RepID=UPI0033FEBA46